jgi:DNA-binding response OmpR family regulator
MAKKILIVDDEEDILLSLQAVLGKEGYDLVTANSGKQALAKLAKNKFDLVLLDFFMPNMNGREVIEKLRTNKSTKGLKIILLTVARFGEAGMKKLTDLEIKDYIEKPYDNKDLVKRVKKVLK